MNLRDVSEATRLRFLGELPVDLHLEAWECAYLSPGYFRVQAVVATHGGFGRVEAQGTGKTADAALDDLLSRSRFRA